MRASLPAGAAALLVLAGDAWAGRPDYSHLSDSELRTAIIYIAMFLAFFAVLGAAGWWRYRRSYQPAPGRFTPNQALFSVLAVLLLVLAGAWMLLFRSR